MGNQKRNSKDQTICKYFLESGECLYKNNCWFKHPVTAPPKEQTHTPLNLQGDPENNFDESFAHLMKDTLKLLDEDTKPKEETICKFYLKNNCKFGNQCRNSHNISNPTVLRRPSDLESIQQYKNSKLETTKSTRDITSIMLNSMGPLSPGVNALNYSNFLSDSMIDPSVLSTNPSSQFSFSNDLALGTAFGLDPQLPNLGLPSGWKESFNPSNQNLGHLPKTPFESSLNSNFAEFDDDGIDDILAMTNQPYSIS